MRSKKTALLNSVLSLILCISMLLGTTFAWFTDEVTSENNIIKSGTLDAKMWWKNPSDTEWKDASTGAIFNYSYWEPGYVEAKCLKLENAGDLAFQYRLFVVPNNDAVGMKLAEVLDVYVSDAKIDDRTDIASMKRLGTLKELMANPNGVDDGVLLPAATEAVVDVPTGEAYTGSVEVSIALKMQETAGNDYQNLNLGNGFKVQLLATQYTYEKDSFGSNYDVNAEWPEGGYTGSSTPSAPSVNAASGTKEVTVDNEGKTVGNTTIETNNADVKATLPEGVKMADGATSANFSVTPKIATDSNVTTSDSQSMTSLDVHVEGVSSTNTTPIIVELGKMLDIGLNLGNVKIFHVEGTETIEMTQVTTLGELTAHNQFYYDPATGFVTVAMATFSEIAVVAEPAKWNGEYDFSWYDASKTELTIANADQLAGFGAIVGGMLGQTADSFKGKTVKLICDIVIGDLTDEDGRDVVFYPIGYYNDEGTYEKSNKAISSAFRKFEGTFDGNGHTISDFYQNTWEMKGDHNWYPAEEQRYRDGMGLFGKVYGGTVKNLTVRNFSSDGEITTTGVIAAYADCGATFENIAIFNCNPRVYNIGNGGIVGCVGWYANENVDAPVTFRNITVDNTNKISALWGSYDVACGGIVGQYYPTSGQENAIDNVGIHFENCHVAAQMDVYNDVCGNYQYYAYRYAGILLGSVRENVTIDGREYPDMDGITASGCTVHFGDWNDYYYCELVANSLASYTHDHQMSRLEQVEKVNAETKKYLPLGKADVAENWVDIPATGRQNYVVVKAKDANGMWIHGDGHDYAECYHFVNGVQHFHDVADSDNPDIYETVNGVEGVLKEDKQLIYREFNNLVTGYGWGVTSKGVDDMQGVEILDKSMDGSSVAKFEKAETALDAYTSTVTVNIGDLFAAIANAGVAIEGDQVHVTVSPVVGTTSTAGGEYTANATDWTKGTLKFTGTGAAAVTISDYYFCKTTTIYVNILPVVPLAISAEGYKTVFAKGDAFAPGENFKVTAANSNGTFADVTADVQIQGFDSAEAGVTIITVSYTLNGKTVSTTYEVRVIAPVRIKVDVLKNKFNIGHTLTTQDFKVTAYSSDGTSTTVSNFDISNKNNLTVNDTAVTITDKTNNLSATVAISVMNITVLTNKTLTWFFDGVFSVSNGANSATWIPYANYGEYTAANGEVVSGFDVDLKAPYVKANGGKTNAGQNLILSDNHYGLTVTNAVPYTTLGIGCIAGYTEPIKGYGYIIDGEPSTLEYTPIYPSQMYTESNPGGIASSDGVNDWTVYDLLGPYNGHAMPQLNCYKFEPGKQYTVTWVAVFDDGIQKISDWTVKMAPASENNKVFVDDPEKPNVNVIVLAGQSNMYGATPITPAVRENYANVDYSNVYIHYNNINVDLENGGLKTYYSNPGFDMYTLGIGAQGNNYFGPEAALAKELATNAATKDEQWYIIKYAAAGTGLKDAWLTGAIVNDEATTLYAEMKDYVQTAITNLENQGYDVQIRSFLWMQGENDALSASAAGDYGGLEGWMVTDFRTTFAANATRNASNQAGSGISFIDAGIANYKSGINAWEHAATVNNGKISNAQQVYDNAAGTLVANPTGALTNSIYIKTDHLLSKLEAPADEQQHYPAGDETDGAHYAASSMETLGGCFALCTVMLIEQNP